MTRSASEQGCEMKESYCRQSKHRLDRLHVPAVEAHHAPSQKLMYEYMKESVAWVRVKPTKQAFEERIDDVKQGHSQNNKLSRARGGQENREQGEAKHEADQSCQIAGSEDEESIPSAHC